MHNVNRPIDAKRDEYRKYLERSGVLQAISRSLTKLYELNEKPSDAIRFVYDSIGESYENNDINSTKELANELDNERAKVRKLTAELDDLKAKFAEADAADEDAMLEDPPLDQESVAVATEPTTSVVEQPGSEVESQGKSSPPADCLETVGSTLSSGAVPALSIVGSNLTPGNESVSESPDESMSTETSVSTTTNPA